jgi:ABC-type branched-subunit amino acid transport system ATPase component
MTALDAPAGQSPPSEDLVPALEAFDVEVRFGGLKALASVSLAVPTGKIVGLVGPNGAGKSTLFGVLSGLLRPYAGRVHLAGEDVTHASPQVRARRGLARTFQQPELFMGLTVREHLVLAHRVRYARRRLWTDLVDGRALRPADRLETERVDSLLELLGLTSVAHHSVSGLPLGMSRRVEVARALASRPSVVLLDEPCAGLDSRETEQFSAALVRVVADSGVSMVMVEHDVGVVLGLSHTVFVLDFGIMIASGRPDEIRRNPAVRAAYLGDEELVVDGVVLDGVDGVVLDGAGGEVHE